MADDSASRSRAPTIDELVVRYWGPLVAYAHRLLGDVPAAEDVVQHAFVRLWETGTVVADESDARALLYRIVRNLVMNEWRRDRVREAWISDQLSDAPDPMLADGLLERMELRAAIEAAVEQLPRKRQEIFVLSRFHELSNREIASVLGISTQTVANQLVAALRTLRLLLRPRYEDQPYPPLKVVRDADRLTG